MDHLEYQNYFGTLLFISIILNVFRSSDDPPSSPHSFTRKLFQSGKKNSLSVLPTGESDREESRGDSSAQSEDIKDDSCGMHTSEMHHRVSPHTYSLLPTDGYDPLLSSPPHTNIIELMVMQYLL